MNVPLIAGDTDSIVEYRNATDFGVVLLIPRQWEEAPMPINYLSVKECNPGWANA